MTVDEIILFKSELKVLRALERRVQTLKADKDRIIYLLEGVRGIDTAKEPTHAVVDNRLALIEKKDEIDAELESTQHRINMIYHQLDLFDDEMRMILESVYIERIPIVEVAEELNYSEATVKRMINRSIIMHLSTHKKVK